MFKNLKQTVKEFPNDFWILVSALFIDRVGGALIFPFLSLYITTKFDVGMTAVGSVFAIHSISSFIGNMIGGALTDKYGRKSMLIIGLIISAGVSLGMGFVKKWEVFYLLAFFTGFVSNIGGPAVQAMMADILPENKRTEGFGILRVVINLAVTIGPALGGILAGISFMILFVSDFIVSCITALIVFIALPETKPKLPEGKEEQSIIKTMSGYGKVLKNKLFLVLMIFTTFTAIVYMQMNTTLSVFLNQQFGLPAKQFGLILSLNAAMVVLFQFTTTRFIKKENPFRMMALGNIFYAVGFGLYGFVSAYGYFLFAMVIITIGEMIIAPFIQTIIAEIAPEDMRGRYMAAFHISWGIASAVGPLAAGIIIDNYNPNLVWYASGIICFITALGYLRLKSKKENNKLEKAVGN